MTNRIAEPLRGLVFRAIYRHGIRWAWIERAYEKWTAGAVPESCIEELRGKGYGLATECRCRGCIERSCFAMFDQVLVSLATGTKTFTSLSL